jgi:hypothetical protein
MLRMVYGEKAVSLIANANAKRRRRCALPAHSKSGHDE